MKRATPTRRSAACSWARIAALRSVLPAFHQRLGAVLGDLGDDCEVLYVDDGSTASSLNTGTT
ncbi:hypothetical protein ACV348_31300, partial [Pseudomonas aeruginosa]